MWQCAAGVRKVDVLVIGAGTSGVAASLQAARMGRSVVLADELPWVGGMLTSAGVSAADGNYNLRGGIWAEFVDSLSMHYGGMNALRTGWVSNIMFEPQVGQNILSAMIDAEPRIARVRYREIVELDHDAQRLWRVRFKRAASISDGRGIGHYRLYRTRRHSCAPRYCLRHRHGVRRTRWRRCGSRRCQRYCSGPYHVAVLEAAPSPVAMDEPPGYDPAEFACSAINALCPEPPDPKKRWSPAQMLSYGRLPGGKYMINWPICGNDYYADMASLADGRRKRELNKAKARTLRFLYFMHKELGMDSLRIARGVYPTPDGLPLMPYYREGRRTKGVVRFTLPYITAPYAQKLPLYRTAVAVGDYPVDQHHTRYNGSEPLPDLYCYPVPSWGLPAGTLIPDDTDDVIVAEKAVSVSNIVNGTTRLQPVVMQIGQAAGAIAAIAAASGITPREVPVREVQEALLASGGYLLPFCELRPGDRGFEAVQRMGVCGLLRGEGKAEGWTGTTHVYPDSTVTADVLALLYRYYGKEPRNTGSAPIKGKGLAKALRELGAEVPGSVAKARTISRLEYAELVDSCLRPFDIPVDYNGNIILSN